MVLQELGQMMVLAEFTGEIATNGRQRKGEGARKKMEKRFLLDRIGRQGHAPAIYQRFEPPGPILTYPAKPDFSLSNHATVVTQVTYDRIRFAFGKRTRQAFLAMVQQSFPRHGGTSFSEISQTRLTRVGSQETS
jgi:hypothetical protein